MTVPPDGRHDLFGQLAAVGKAFASPKRLELLDVLAQGERSVESLARATGTGLSTVSAHLQILKSARLVATRPEGVRVHYRLAGEDVARLYALMQDVARRRSPDVAAALRSYLGVGIDDIGEISREELAERLDDPGLLVLDVRPSEEYEAGHLPGAHSLPLPALHEALSTEHPNAELERDLGRGDVVVYCRGAWCVLAHDAVHLLQDTGHQARRLQGGMLEWRAESHPVQSAVEQ